MRLERRQRRRRRRGDYNNDDDGDGGGYYYDVEDKSGGRHYNDDNNSGGCGCREYDNDTTGYDCGTAAGITTKNNNDGWKNWESHQSTRLGCNNNDYNSGNNNYSGGSNNKNNKNNNNYGAHPHGSSHYVCLVVQKRLERSRVVSCKAKELELARCNKQRQ